MTDNYREKYLTQLKAVNGIQIQAIPLYSEVPTGVKFEMPVLFRILVGDHSQLVPHQPIHICLTLDRSGSMAGRPLKDCKQAIKHLISQLDPVDRISLVIYDDTVETVFTEKSITDLDTLLPLINQITERGWTNISGALEQSANILNHPIDVSTNYKKLVFLFSDGNTNRGITELDDLGHLMTQWVDKDGIRFSSYGIGSEYNETWMRSIARGGEGNYFFIDKTEFVSNYVEKGLSGFTSIIGNQVHFACKGVNGHALTSFQGDRTLETLMKGKNIQSLRSLGMYQFLSTIEIGARSSQNNSENIMEYQLQFEPVKGLDTASLLMDHLLVQFVEDMTLDDTHKNPEVVCYLMINECGDLNLKVDHALKSHKTSEAIALKQEIITKYESVLSFDKYGIIGALLEKERTTLNSLQKEGASAKTVKFQNYSSSHAYYSNGSVAAGNAPTSMRKSKWESNKSKAQDDDADASFSIFN